MKKFLSVFILLCTAVTCVWAYDQEVCINDGSVTVPDGKHWLVTGNGEVTSNQITLLGASTVTLSGVKISNDNWCMLFNGTCTVILKDGTTNTITCTNTSADPAYPALWVGDLGYSLTITGEAGNTGVLNVTGGDKGVAIGGGHYNSDNRCGNITIQGGVINAVGGSGKPAIGCDESGGTCDIINITGGVRSVTAVKGAGATECIGRNDGACTAVIVDDIVYWYGNLENSYRNGGEEYLQADKFYFANVNNTHVTVPAASRAIVGGTGECWNRIDIGDDAKVTLKGVNIKSDEYCVKCEGDAIIELKETSLNVLISMGGTDYPTLLAGGPGTTLTIQGAGTLKADGGTNCAAIGSSTFADCGDIVISNGVGHVLAIKGGYNTDCIGRSTSRGCGKVTVYGVEYFDGTDYKNNGAAYLRQNRCNFANINYESVTVPGDQHWLVAGTGETTSNHITMEGASTVTLRGVKIMKDSWCMLCNADATVILADGSENSLSSTGAYPALWVGDKSKEYKVTIKGETLGTGALVALGGDNCAGIGGGYHNGAGGCGDIEIQGGIVTAFGGIGAAGIGGDNSGSCGDITISGGVTRVRAWKGSGAVNSIGRGSDSSCGSITINGTEYYNGSYYRNNGEDYLKQEKLAVANVCKAEVTVPGEEYWMVTSAGETASNHIVVYDDGTLLLDEATINSEDYAIKCEGDAVIIPKDHTTNWLTAQNNYPGIMMDNYGKTLTIRGGAENAGTLNVTGADGSVAIGGGRHNENHLCGRVTFEGGYINAYGGSGMGAIGCDCEGGSFDGITITDGVKGLTAVKGEGAVDCIGIGPGFECRFVNIGDEYYWYGTVPGIEKGYHNGGEEYLKADKFFFANVQPSSATVPANAHAIVKAPLVVHPAYNNLTIGDGAKVMLHDFHVDGLTQSGIVCQGDATIVLKDGSTNFVGGKPGIKAAGGGKTLVIEGQEGGTGTLNTQGRDYNPGIGGSSFANILIRGGIINATGAVGAAGIGTSHTGSCGNITISGGTITATGGEGAAGIGGGSSSGSYGNITITDDVNSLTATRGTGATNCIGRGGASTSCSSVTIAGAEYWDGTAYRNEGEGYLDQDQFILGSINSTPFTVPDGAHYVIKGNGEVTSNRITLEGTSGVTLDNVKISNEGWCIRGNSNSTVILKDGTTNTVTSTGTSHEVAYPAIWVGDDGCNLTILGEPLGTGTMIAQGGANSAAIGGGYHNTSSTCGSINVCGGIVTATGGEGAAAIGADKDGKCTAVSITDGVTQMTAFRGSDADQCVGSSNLAQGAQVTIDAVEYYDGTSYKNNGATYLNQNKFVFGNINKGPVTVIDARGLIKGTGETTSNRITFGGTSETTLDNVNISTIGCPVNCKGYPTVILKDGTTNTVTCTGTSGEDAYPALWVGTRGHSNLIIKGETLGTGTLIAQGGTGCAGIGGGLHNTVNDCGGVEIQSGIITAIGGVGAAGIGTGNLDERCGDITISANVKSLTAIKGAGAKNCIGRGNDDDFDKNLVTIGGTLYWDGDNYVNDGDKYLPLNSLVFANINNGDVTVPAEENALIMGSGEETGNSITIGDGAFVGLSGVNIRKTETDSYCIKCLGSATVDLLSGTTNTLLTENMHSIALRAGDSGTTLTIDGSGTLNATSRYSYPGIGGGYGNLYNTCGNITINGGHVTAVGASKSAAIGSDFGYDCGTVTIGSNVACVTAVTSDDAVVCLGSNHYCPGVYIDGIERWDGSEYKNSGEEYIPHTKFVFGNINKSAVTVPAGGRGLINGTGEETSNNILIGDDGWTMLNGVNIANASGDYCVKCEGDATVILADKTMNTLSGTQSIYPALLAGGTGTTLTVKGKGALKALGGATSPAIGGGGLYDRECGNIVFESGIIDARGGTYSTAIGAAPGGSCGNITVANGVTHLVAKRGTDCNQDCIGRSIYGGSCGSVTINGVEYWDGEDYVNGGRQYLEKGALAHLKGNEGATGEYWTTFYYDANHFQAPEGTQVFKAALDGTSLTLSPISDRVVNSEQGTILKSNSPYFFLTSTDNGTTSEGGYENNSLQGTSSTITNPGNAYVLNKKKGIVGFYKLSDTGTITAGKSYLTYDGGSGARELLPFNEDPTGIKTMEDGRSMTEEEGDEVWYDMSGRKLNDRPTKRGFYIVNGQKVFVN